MCYVFRSLLPECSTAVAGWTLAGLGNPLGAPCSAIPHPNTLPKFVLNESYTALCGAGWIELITCVRMRPDRGENMYVDVLWTVIYI